MVEDDPSTLVSMDQGERRARHCDLRRDSEACGQPLHKNRLAGSEVSRQDEHVARPKERGEHLAERLGRGLASAFDDANSLSWLRHQKSLGCSSAGAGVSSTALVSCAPGAIGSSLPGVAGCSLSAASSSPSFSKSAKSASRLVRS